MHLWPHLREYLLGPVGFALLGWCAAIIWLGLRRREKTLGFVLVASAILLTTMAYGAYQESARAYSPSRDMPLVLSGLFITFSFAAFICATFALAILSAPASDWVRRRRAAAAAGPAERPISTHGGHSP